MGMFCLYGNIGFFFSMIDFIGEFNNGNSSRPTIYGLVNGNKMSGVIEAQGYFEISFTATRIN
jgi:sRNA-binding regulator protein Hfq